MCDCWMRVRLGHDSLCLNTEAEREQIRQFNGRMIEELCELGEKIIDLYAADIRRCMPVIADANQGRREGVSGGIEPCAGSKPTTCVLPFRQSAAEQCGMTETQYRYAESLYLHGDLSGR